MNDIPAEVDRFGMIDEASGHEPLYWGRTNDVQPWGVSGEQYVKLSDYTTLERERDDLLVILNRRQLEYSASMTRAELEITGTTKRAETAEAKLADARKALEEAIEFGEQDFHYLTPAGEAMVQRWRDALAALDAEANLEMGADRAAQAERMARLEEALREAEYNVKSRLRLAFRKALAELPEIAPAEIRSVLSSVHMQDEFMVEGKRLQRVHGLDAVAPRVEQECGAGAWSFMRQGVARALSQEGSDA